VLNAAFFLPYSEVTGQMYHDGYKAVLKKGPIQRLNNVSVKNRDWDMKKEELAMHFTKKVNESMAYFEAIL